METRRARDDAPDIALRESVFTVFGICAFFYALAAIRSTAALEDGNILSVYWSPFSQMALGMLSAEHVQDGQWWRLISYMFLHGNLLHLIFNLSALAYLGPMILEKFGLRGFWSITLIAGVGGGLVSLVYKLTFPAGPTLGLSGALFGYAGALYAAFRAAGDPAQTQRFGKLLIFINAISFGLSFMGMHIDNACHVGGMVAGMLAGWVTFRFSSASWLKRTEQIMIVGGLGVWIWGMWSVLRGLW